jgi:hypothetical protein
MPPPRTSKSVQQEGCMALALYRLIYWVPLKYQVPPQCDYRILDASCHASENKPSKNTSNRSLWKIQSCMFYVRLVFEELWTKHPLQAPITYFIHAHLLRFHNLERWLPVFSIVDCHYHSEYHSQFLMGLGETNSSLSKEFQSVGDNICKLIQYFCR